MRAEITVVGNPELNFTAEVEDEIDIARILSLLNRGTSQPVIHVLVPEHAEA